MLLVVCLFLLGCIVFSSIGSIINIRKQIEVNNFLSKHNTTEKSAGRNRCFQTLELAYLLFSRFEPLMSQSYIESIGHLLQMSAHGWD